ncbi:MAG: cupin domain-containing protein [Gaiellaceae bacterium]
MINLRDCELEAYDEGPAGHRFAKRHLGGEVGAERTGFGVYELEPGQATWPYHFEVGSEEWLVVIEGELTVRTPDGERRLHTGDVLCFPEGPTGAHAVRNDSSAVVRFAMPSVDGTCGGAVYPESGKLLVYGPGFHHRGRMGEQVEYWEGE